MEINSATSAANVTTSDQVGLNGLTSESFMRLLIAQLQNQDPTEPVGNEELLNQISMMRNLQSNIELSDALKSISSNQNLSTAATFIGKSVTGTTSDRESLTGVVDRAFLANGEAFVGIGGQSIAIGEITSVNLAE